MAITRLGLGSIAAGGSALQIPRINSAGTGWEFTTPSTSQIAVYAATLADVVNTVAETTALSFVIPANSMSDGDLITVSMWNLYKNNKGTSGGVLYKSNVGSGSQVTLRTATFGDSAIEQGGWAGFSFMRVGNDLRCLNGGYTHSAGFATDASGTASPGITTPANFTSDQTAYLKVTLDAANASFYFKPQRAKVIHYKS